MKFHKLLWKHYFFEDTGRLVFFIIVNLLVLLSLIGCPVWILAMDSIQNNTIPAMVLLFGGMFIVWMIYLGLSFFFTIRRRQFPQLYEFFRFFRRF